MSPTIAVNGGFSCGVSHSSCSTLPADDKGTPHRRTYRWLAGVSESQGKTRGTERGNEMKRKKNKAKKANYMQYDPTNRTARARGNVLRSPCRSRIRSAAWLFRHSRMAIGACSQGAESVLPDRRTPTHCPVIGHADSMEESEILVPEGLKTGPHIRRMAYGHHEDVAHRLTVNVEHRSPSRAEVPSPSHHI